MRETVMDAAVPRLRRFTRVEYERMAAEGILRPDERVELLDGEILIMTPQGARHTRVLHLLADALRGAFGRRYYVRIQSPLALGNVSEPEPDVAVVPGSARDYETHPTTALLVAEVSEGSLALDREGKGPIYAQTGIPEYWIANLVENVLEVYRKPKGKKGYRQASRMGVDAKVRPLGVAKAIAIASFLA